MAAHLPGVFGPDDLVKLGVAYKLARAQSCEISDNIAERIILAANMGVLSLPDLVEAGIGRSVPCPLSAAPKKAAK